MDTNNNERADANERYDEPEHDNSTTLDDVATVTVTRDMGDSEPMDIAVMVSTWDMGILDAIDEQGMRVALTPMEERYAKDMVALGVDETGR